MLGQCQCGGIQFRLELPLDLSQYQPRACDCDFCTARQIHYLSDPAGVLYLPRESIDNYQQQGDRQANFITCRSCADVIVVTCQFGDKVKGAVNAQLLIDKNRLGVPQNVSPKRLTAEEKLARWTQVWMEIQLED